MCSRAGDTVQFKCRRHQSKRTCGPGDAVVNLDMSVFGMNTGVEEIITREEPKRQKIGLNHSKTKPGLYEPSATGDGLEVRLI
jgi:hypothetical protein